MSENKKVKIIAVVTVILAIAAVAFGVLWNSSKDSRAMSKALESGDIRSVQQMYRRMDAKGETDKAVSLIVKTISDMTEKVNNDLTVDTSRFFDMSADAVEDAFDTVFRRAILECLNLDEDFLDELEELDNSGIDNAIDSLNDMLDSKYNYYLGVSLAAAAKEPEDFEDASEALNDVISTDKNYEDAVKKAGEASEGYLNAVMKLADEYIAKGDHDAAVELLEKAGNNSSLKGSADFNTKIAEIKKNSAQKYIDEANTLLMSGDTEGAVGKMEAAYAINPSDENKAKLDQYKLYEPFKMYDREKILYFDNKNYIHCNSSLKANTSDIYENVINSDVYTGSSAKAGYNLNGNYNYITGTIFLCDKYKNQKHNSWFEVYGDGKLLYTSPKMTAGFLPQDINIDVTGVHKLEIVFKSAGDYLDQANCSISNLVAKKNPPKQ